MSITTNHTAKRESAAKPTDLETQACLDVLLQRLGDGLVKVTQDLHSQLRVDPLVTDEIIKGICQSHADTAF